MGTQSSNERCVVMPDQKKPAERSEQESKPKFPPYNPPTLTVYGHVTKLTASGTGTVAENGNQPNCSTSSTRKPC